MRKDVIKKIEEEKIIAILRGYTEEETLNMARALCAGGVKLMELTFPQDSEEKRLEVVRILKKLNAELGDTMCFGAGTVTDCHMVDLAYEAGCHFVIAPDMDPEVIEATRKRDMVSIPGAYTPSEIKQAIKHGADFVKVFPAVNMGPSYIKNVCAPLTQAKLLAVGGVNAENAAEFFKAGCCGAGVGSALFSKEQVKSGDWAGITENAKKLRAALGLA